MQGATGTCSDANGFYVLSGERNFRDIYQQVEGLAKIYFNVLWKISLGSLDEWVFCHPQPLLLQPPCGSEWMALEDSSGPAPSISYVPSFLLVEHARKELNGKYARAENFGGKPKFRQVGGSGVVFFHSTWKIRDGEKFEDVYYHPDSEDVLPPVGDWKALHGEEVSKVCHLLTSPRYLWVHGAGAELNGCYAQVGCKRGKPKYLRMGATGKIFYVSGFWRMESGNARDECYRHSNRPSETPPAQGWTNGDGKMVDLWLQPQPSYSVRSSLPFVVVRGGHPRINGRYFHMGWNEEKPKYKQMLGHSIIFFQAGLWRLNDEENLENRIFDGSSQQFAN